MDLHLSKERVVEAMQNAPKLPALMVSALAKRTLSALSCAVLSAVLPAVAHAWQPSGPIRLVVPYSPGGAADVAARLIASSIGDGLGQPIVIENRPGANGVIGANYAYSAAPNGQTLLFAVTDVISAAPHVNSHAVKFDADRFAAVAPVGRGGYVLVSGQKNAKASFNEVMTQLKTGEGLNYGHWGAGSMSQMAMEQFKLSAKLPKILPVPYNGSAPVMNAVMAGEVDYAFVPPGLAAAAVPKVKMYAVSSEGRVPLVGAVPTLKELGYDVQAETLYCVVAPPGTSPEIVEFYSKKILEVTRKDAFKTRLTELGYSSVVMSPRELSDYLRSESKHWAALVKQAKLKVD